MKKYLLWLMFPKRTTCSCLAPCPWAETIASGTRGWWPNYPQISFSLWVTSSNWLHLLNVPPTPQIEPSTKNWVVKTWSAGAFHIQPKMPPLKLEMWSWGCHLLNNCWLLDFQWVLYPCFSFEGTHALLLVFNCTVANVKTKRSVIPVPESCTRLWIRASNQIPLN